MAEKVSITICGDGGCGTSTSRFCSEWLPWKGGAFTDAILLHEAGYEASRYPSFR